MGEGSGGDREEKIRGGRNWIEGVTDELQERWGRKREIIGGTGRFLACINI